MSRFGARATAWFLLLAAFGISLGFETRTIALLPGHHGVLSAKALTLGRNLSPRYHFLLFVKKTIDAAGHEHLQAYNSFPILSFALIAGVLSFQADDPGAEIRAGRLLMLFFFLSALAASYLLVHKWTERPLLSAAVVLLSFSSTTMQYYNDMVFNDVPALFGVVLLLLGITTVELGGSARILWVATFLSVALGWQGFAPLACWWILTALTILGARDGGLGVRLRALLRHRATAVFLVSLGWGGSLLASNLISEKLAMQQAFADLPSFRSMKFRLGLAPRADDAIKFPELEWDHFLSTQARRLMKAAVPTRELHQAADSLSQSTGARQGLRLVLVFGAALALSSYFVVRLLRDPPGARARLALATAALGGPAWIVGMRNFSAFHEFQSLFYVGTVLVLYTAVLVRLPDRAMLTLAVAALGMYTWSCVDFNRQKTLEGLPWEERTRDFAVIRKQVGKDRRILLGRTNDDVVEVTTGARYYLAGNYFSAPEQAEFVLNNDPREAAMSLTPHNRDVFLFAYSPTDSRPRESAPPSP